MTLLFAVLTALLMAIGYIVGLYFGDPLSFMLLGLGLAAVFNFVSYYYSDSLVLRMSRAKIITENENLTLFNYYLFNVDCWWSYPWPIHAYPSFSHYI